MLFIILCVLLVPASDFAQAMPAWALEPSSVEAVSPLWTGRDLGRGKTFYSQGLNTTTQITPQGPSSYFAETWSPDRMNTVGTIYGLPGSLPPPASLLAPPTETYRACEPYCAYPKR